MKKTSLFIFMIFILGVMKNSAAIPSDPFSTPNALQKMQSRFFMIHYAKASELAKFISNKSMKILSPQGHINVDERNNLLWAEDFSSNLNAVKNILGHLDTPKTVIQIKARVVHIDSHYAKSLGFNFVTKTPDKESGLNMNFPFTANSAAGHFSVPILRLQNSTLLDLEIDALEEQGHAKLISSPELIALNGETASIESGQEVPYQEKTYVGGTSVMFKKAALRLEVTPKVMLHDQILLNLTLTQDKVSTLSVQNMPVISTQKITTQVLVKNNATVVLGGIFEQEDTQNNSNVPGLSKIPLLGTLFKKKNQNNNRKELLIFVTPTLLNE